jgi:hypothetical protein
LPDESKSNPKASRPDATLPEVLAGPARLKRQSAEMLKRMAELDELVAQHLVGAAKPKPRRRP